MDTRFSEERLALLTDFYELTMTGGLLREGLGDRIVYFDLFFRHVPDGGGTVIAAGLEQLAGYLESLRFDEADLAWLGDQGFGADFLAYLRDFRFTCDVWAVPEGTPVFPQEPILTVRGPAAQAQFIETMALLCLNHQSLIATKANRIVRAAQGREVTEFGARRAQGFDGAVYGARAAYIGGCAATSCTLAAQRFGIPAAGTMAHSWVQLFDSELDAFRAYARQYPADCTLLVDTYNTLGTGVPSAITAFREVVVPAGHRPAGIRIDSGDIAYLSRKARQLLDDAGFPDCKIVASNALDEYLIRDMILQGARVDSFGVGERLITAASEPVLGGVYKLAAVEQNGVILPRIKVSENVAKITLPCFKKLWRLYDDASGKALADVLTLHDEDIASGQPYEIFDPDHVWKRKVLTGFTAKPLMTPVFRGGKRVYGAPPPAAIREHCAAQVATLWDEVLRFEHPHRYYVDLSQRLWDERQRLLSEYGR